MSRTADDRPRVLDDRERDTPFAAAGQEGAGAIDRIDDEGAEHAEAIGIVGRLLREPAIDGARGEQARGEQAVDGKVGFTDDRGRAFCPTPRVLPEVGEREGGGLARRGDEKIEVTVLRHTAFKCRRWSDPRWRRSAH